MKLIKKLIPLALAAALMCTVGCTAEKTPEEKTTEATQPADPTGKPIISDAVEEWDTPGDQDTSNRPTQPGESQPTTQPTTPTQPTEQPTAGDKLTYEQYMAMPTSQQEAYFRSFPTVEAFYEWLEAAEAEYEKNQNTVTGDGKLDLNDYINGNR